ncbi:MAG: hypothetical protein U0L83_03830 [Muribaculaceae bacterium]|nr:hypothetical protein [Muribaculaceae bacterium]
MKEHKKGDKKDKSAKKAKKIWKIRNSAVTLHSQNSAPAADASRKAHSSIG